MEKVLGFIKNRWKYILVAIIALIIGSAVGPSQTDLDDVTKSNDKLSKQVEELKANNTESETKIAELEAKVKEAEPFFQLQEEERLAKEAEAKAAEEKRIAEEKAKAEAEAAAKAQAEAEAKAKAEAEAKIGYETGITYNQLARTPDDYIFEKVKFKGKVVQVMEGDGITQVRIAVNDNYDTILFGEYDSSVVSSRILEDDKITIYGISTGLITYQSTMGGNISIPGVSIEKIDQ